MKLLLLIKVKMLKIKIFLGLNGVFILLIKVKMPTKGKMLYNPTMR